MSSVISQRQSRRQLALQTRWSLVVVRVPTGWRAEEWDDEPLGADILWTERGNLPLSRARNLMFGYNSAAMEDRGRTWAIIQPDIGRMAGRVGLIPFHNHY